MTMMLHRLKRTSLRTKTTLLAGTCVLLGCSTAMLMGDTPGDWRETVRTLSAAVAVSVGLFVSINRRIFMPLARLQRDLSRLVSGDDAQLAPDPLADREVRRLRSGFRRLALQIEAARVEDEAARDALEARNRTVERLLEFSQITNGLSDPQQVLDVLTHYLRNELHLAAVAVVGPGEDDSGRAVVQTRFPPVDGPAHDFEASSCPCLRQGLPRSFTDASCPGRCGIEKRLEVEPSQPALCMPLPAGESRRLVVHMVRPARLGWDEQSRQIAQAMLNTAGGVLVVLDLLEDARRKSMTDPLTGLYNRRTMDQMLKRELALASRHAQPLTLMMIDLDRFKPINDRHGHAAGDWLLKTFARTLLDTLRRTDLAFRVGGDEFVVLLPQTRLHQARQVVGKLRSALASVNFAQGITNLQETPHFSVGLVEADPEAPQLTPEQLLEAADQQMYQAKRDARESDERAA